MTSKPITLYLCHAPEAVYDIVRACCGDATDLRFLATGNRNEREQLMAEADAVIVAADRLDSALLGCAPRLRLVHHQGVGYHDTIDLDALRRCGARLAITRTGTTQSVAEHTVLLALAVLRRLPFLDASTRQGEWHINSQRAEAGLLAGRMIGYFGMGHIGRATAALFRAFDTRGIYFNRSGALPAADEERLGVTAASLEDVLAQADIVSIHLPLTDDTRGLIGRDAIARMRRGSIIINTARGAIIDNGALVDGLRSGQLGGAGLDVFDPEPPPPQSPLLLMPNVVVTPHVAAATKEALSQKMQFLGNNIERFFRTGLLEDEVQL